MTTELGPTKVMRTSGHCNLRRRLLVWGNLLLITTWLTILWLSAYLVGWRREEAASLARWGIK
jgi:hypothetical protein